MELTWLGTAGFRIVTDKHAVLIDPYLTRNEKALPKQSLKPSDIQDGDAIFISHGHFDHIYDVPVIASKTGAKVYCGKGIDDTLFQNGVNKDQINCVHSDGETFDLNGLQAQAFFSKHVKFDRWLLIKTFARINFRLFHYLPLIREYPEGQVLSWRFIIEGKVVHHFGSAGSTPEELKQFGKQKTDILLVPLQGHSLIIQIASKYVQALQPKIVVPNHQDNFFPPISTMIDTHPFVERVRKTNPNTKIQILGINETVTF